MALSELCPDAVPAGGVERSAIEAEGGLQNAGVPLPGPKAEVFFAEDARARATPDEVVEMTGRCAALGSAAPPDRRGDPEAGEPPKDRATPDALRVSHARRRSR